MMDVGLYSSGLHFWLKLWNSRRRRRPGGCGAHAGGAECVEHEEIFHWRQLREEEAVASGDVDDFVAVAAAAARRSDAL